MPIDVLTLDQACAQIVKLNAALQKAYDDMEAVQAAADHHYYNEFNLQVKLRVASELLEQKDAQIQRLTEELNNAR